MSSEAEANDAPPPDADTCPFCLRFEGVAAARDEGQRYCPLCGGDWAQSNVPVDVPPAFRSAPAADAFAPDAPDDDTDPNVPGVVAGRETSRAAAKAERPLTSSRAAPPPVDPPAPLPTPPASAGPPLIGPVTIALLFGLGLAVAAGVFHERLFPAAPPAAPPPRAAPAEPAVAAPPRAAPPPKPAPPAPPPLPSPADAPDRRAEAVEQAIGEALRDADRATRVEVKAQVEGGVAFLTGAVDSQATLDRVSAAAAEVFGVRAVDTRGVEMKWRRHTVAPGDTLVGLARRYYGDATAWHRIWRANADLANGPTGIRAGTVLVIPTGQP